MNRHLKRMISFTFVLILVMSFAAPAFAEGTIMPLTGTITVGPDSFYEYGDGGNGYIRLQLAAGTKSFTIKRSEVKLTNNTVDAKFIEFRKSNSSSNVKDEYWTGKKFKTSTLKGKNCSYTIQLQISKAVGTVTVNYKIGNKPYSVKLNIRNDINPLKKVTMTGVNGGKNLVSKTDSFRTDLKLTSDVKNAKVKVVPAKGWLISQVYMEDLTTKRAQSVGHTNYAGTKPGGLSSASLNWGTLKSSDCTYVSVTLVNKSTGMQKHCGYYINYDLHY